MHDKKGKIVDRIKIVEMESAVHRYKKQSVKRYRILRERKAGRTRVRTIGLMQKAVKAWWLTALFNHD